MSHWETEEVHLSSDLQHQQNKKNTPPVRNVAMQKEEK